MHKVVLCLALVAFKQEGLFIAYAYYDIGPHIL